MTMVKENFFGDLLSKQKPMWTVTKKFKVIKLLHVICDVAIEFEVLSRQYKTYRQRGRSSMT